MQSARTNKKVFLEKMDSLIPWDDWVSIIEPIYYKGRVGQKPYAIDLMLRIYILQNFYDLSDMGVMYEIIDSRAFSDFCGVSTPDQVPNGEIPSAISEICLSETIYRSRYLLKF